MEFDLPVSSDMTRTQIYLTSKERKFFKRIAYEKETTMSEVIREALDHFIETPEGENING